MTTDEHDLIDDTPTEAFVAALSDAYAILVLGHDLHERANAKGESSVGMAWGITLTATAMLRIAAPYDDSEADQISGNAPPALHELRAMLDAHRALPAPPPAAARSTPAQPARGRSQPPRRHPSRATK